MKKLFYLVLAAVLFVVGCSESFDDSKIWDKLDDHESRIAKLEELCKQMNTNISSLQTLVNALNQNDYITNVAPISKNGEEVGYTITFKSGKTITIYHDKDGLTPVVGVKLFNGDYHWTVDGEWLLDDNGNKIKAVGSDGTDGKDGITPQLKIEEGYWYISYDNGASWKQLGKATGEDGKDGQDGANGADGKDGDSFFQSVTQDDEYVYFTLADGTQITLAKEQVLEITFNTEECFVNGGESYEVTYTITGADADTKIAAMAHDNYTVKVVPTDYKSGKIVVTAPSADITESQVLVFVSKGTQTIMRVLYFVKGVLTISTDNVSLEYDDTTFEVKVTTNLDYTVHIPEEASSWLSVASTRAIREETLSFAVEENTTAERRSTIVELRNNGKTVQSIAVSQNVNPKYIPASNQIFYTSTNGKIVEPKTPSAFGAVIVSNTYANGVGVIVFDRNITTIGDWAFSGCSLTSITIPDSVTEIGDSAFFGCNSLTSITIPDSVTTIGDYAFQYCSSLTSVTIPDSVTTIGRYAFLKCSSLTTITIGDSVTEIESYAFEGCSSLTRITIPDSVTEIGRSAFFSCSSLTSVTIGDSVTTIGESAFSNCSNLTSITIPDSVTSIASYAFTNCSSLKSVNITDIAAWCSISFAESNNPLYYAPNLYLNGKLVTDLVIPDSVTTIGNYAFRNCSSLTSITIPDSVTTIGMDAFSGCKSLASVTIGDSVTTIGNQAFQYCSSLTSVSIGDSVTYIGEFAFDNCSSLTSITIPDSVTTIGRYAFLNCSSLTSIAIPDSVTTIEWGAFYGCSNLTSVTIPDSVTTIGNKAFHGCSSLTTAVIGSGVKSIGSSAFENCIFLNEIICKPTTPPTAVLYSGAWNAFKSIGTSPKIYVPVGSGDAYKAAKYWSDYASIIEEKAM